VFDERQNALAIQFLRRRLQAAEDARESRALIEALRETLAEFEAGRMPHRYGSPSSNQSRDGIDPV
jgi:hypothetical protein